MFCSDCGCWVPNTANHEMRKEGCYAHSHVCYNGVCDMKNGEKKAEEVKEQNMARYNDTDNTIKAIRDRFNIYFEIPCDSDDRRVQEIISQVKKVILEQPTADVVPKSEFEQLEMTLEVTKLNLANAREKLNDAESVKATKIDPVKEIFEELENLVEHTAFADCWSEGGFRDGLAELKKKYAPA